MSETVIALDVGEARIGLAKGEVGSSLAFGRGFIERRGLQDDVAAVVRAAREEGAARVVVGMPVRTDGKDSPQTGLVREFARALEGAGLEVIAEDERFSTRIAGDRILASGVGRNRRREKGRVDEASAIVILESYLQRVAPR